MKLQIKIKNDGKYWTAECPEIQNAGIGCDPDSASKALLDVLRTMQATILYGVHMGLKLDEIVKSTR